MRTRFPLLYSLLNKSRRDLHLLALRWHRQANDPKVVFGYFHERNLFGDPESSSGTGSSLAATRTIRAALPPLFATLNVKIILDVPCGDFHWAAELDWTPYRYIGADTVPAIVERNQSLYTSNDAEFRVLDIVTDSLPACDLILCRDLFIHFPNSLIRDALRNVSRSGARYLLTTHYSGARRNLDIKLGSFRPINLTLPPFDLPVPEHTIPDGDYLPLWDRSLALWPLDEAFRIAAYGALGPGMDK